MDLALAKLQLQVRQINNIVKFRHIHNDLLGEIPKIYKTPEGAKVKPSMELKIEESGDLYERLMKACQDYTDSSGIKYASTINAVLEMLSTDEDDDEPSPVMQAECQDSDLLPGIYEGIFS